jgi:hypothetical protein
MLPVADTEMVDSGQPDSNRGLALEVIRSIYWQVAAAVLVWAYLIGLHWNNDGLWYQGDAPSHAIDGAFLLDLMRRLPLHPIEFAFNYYGRYPALTTSWYPPFFYFLEAIAYSLFGISAFIAKGLILGFAILATFYLCAWLRRWVGPELGWAAPLLLLQPGFVRWAHAVMLNLPSAALSFASLYHWRRWLEHRSGWHLYSAAAFALAATLTYTPAVGVVFVMIFWAVLAFQIQALLDRRVLTTAGICAVLLLPWAVVTMKWDQAHQRLGLFHGDYPFWKFASWLYYGKLIPHLATWPILVASLISIAVACFSKRWRKEILLGTSWFVLTYIWFSLFAYREDRYVLLLAPSLVLLATVTIAAISSWVVRTSPKAASPLTVGVLALVMVFHLAAARRVHVPRVSGFKEIVSYIQHLAPNQFVFYDGYYDHVFTFYMRASDPGFQRGVVRSSKLLYAVYVDPRHGLVERVASSSDVVSRLSRECGCRFLVVERDSRLESQAMVYLREALKGTEFRLVRTFPVETPDITQVDVFEFIGPVTTPEYFEIPFPVLGPNEIRRVKPYRP